MTIKIPLLMTFIDKGSKNALKTMGKLERSASRLGRTLGVSLGTAAVVAFGKASAKAFLEDDKAANKLNKTLQNLGISFEAPAVADFISKMQKATGIADDELRPAFSQLVIATNDATQAQQLLGLALDISAGTGKDLASVTGALQKAFLGNTTALSKLGVGLTKAELASKDFYSIQEKLTKTFGGDAAANAKTYAGQLAILARSVDDVKETIGKGLIDALVMLGKNHNVQDLDASMQSLAVNTADVIRGLGLIAEKIDRITSKLGGVETLIQAIPIVGTYILALQEAGAEQRKNQELAAKANASQFVSIKKLRELEWTAAQKLAKQRAAEAAKTKKTIADQAKLKQASAMFDLDRIQIEAALKGKINEEERIRLELQKAILNENLTQVQKLQAELAINQQKTKELTDLLAHLPKADDPFADWPSIIGKINGLLKDLKLNVTAAQLLGQQGYSLNASGTDIVKSPSKQPTIIPPPPPPPTPENPPLGGNTPSASILDTGLAVGLTSIATDGESHRAALMGVSASSPTITVNVYNEGSVVSSQDLTDQIVEQIYVRQANGIGINYNARTAI